MCIGLTKQGKQCARTSMKGEDYCKSHINQKPVVEVEPIVEVEPVVEEVVVEEPAVEEEVVEVVEKKADIETEFVESNITSGEMTPQIQTTEPSQSDSPVDYIKAGDNQSQASINNTKMTSAKQPFIERGFDMTIRDIMRSLYGGNHIKKDTSAALANPDKYCIQVNFDDAGKTKRLVFGFDTQSDRDGASDAVFDTVKKGPVQYCLDNELIDQRIYDLGCLIKSSWYGKQENIWNFAGLLSSIDIDTDKTKWRHTYASILNTVCGNAFNIKYAIEQFNKWVEKQYVNKFKESDLKAIAGGSNSDGYKEWRAKWEPVAEKRQMTDNDKLPLNTKLKLDLLEKVGDKYRREFGSGVIYERKLDYYYERKYADPISFMNVIFADDNTYSITARKSDRDELCDFIKRVAHPKFPFMEINYDYIGFSNGVYDLSTATFLTGDDIPKGIQVRKMINMVFEIKETPLLDKYFSYQFEDPEELEFIYFTLGRMLTLLDDKFDFMLMISGQAGCGKSLLANLIKYAFDNSQIGILSSSLEEQYGLSTFTDRQIVACDDMPHKINKIIEKSKFLSMTSRGAVSCPVKYGVPIEVPDWRIPTMINSNHLPNYKDVAGEIIRRLVIIAFANIVPESERDNELQSKIIANEYGAFIHRCRSTYLKLATMHKGKDVSTFMPETFKTNRDDLRKDLNMTYQFATAKLVYEKGHKILKSEMTTHLRDYVKEQFRLEKTREALNPPDIVRANDKFVFKKDNVCIKCRKLPKACKCKNPSKKRTTIEYFLNAKFSPYGLINDDEDDEIVEDDTPEVEESKPEPKPSIESISNVCRVCKVNPITAGSLYCCGSCSDN